MEAKMIDIPRGAELIVVGGVNVDLDGIDGQGRDDEIAAAIATSGIEDPAGHFLLQQKTSCKGWWTWAMVSQGRLVRFWTEYILVSHRQIFQNMTVRDPRHKSYYLVVMGFLRSASLREHLCYLRGNTRLPL